MRIVMYIIITLAFLDMFAQFPIMSPYAQSLGAGSLMIGFVIGSYSFTNLFGNLLAGKWIDRYGGKKIVVIGMISTGCFVGLYTFAQTPEQLIVIRLAHGMVSGLLAPSVFTWISQNTRASGMKQGKNMAFSGAAVGIAAILGPALSGSLKSILGIHAVFIFMSSLLLLGGLITLLFIKYEPLSGQNRQQKRDSASTQNEWSRLLRNRHAIQSYLGAFTLMSAMGVLTYMLPLKANELGFVPQSAGFMMSTFGIVAVAIFLLPTNRLFDRINLNTIMVMGFSLLAVSVWMLYLFSLGVMLYAAMGVYGLGFALIFPSITKNLVEHVPQQSRGKAFGLFYAIYSLGVVFGSVLIGIITSTTDDGFRMAAIFLTIMSPTILMIGRLKG